MSRIRSLFGRTDADAVAQPHDYAVSQIANDSAAPGASLQDALSGLQDRVALALPESALGADKDLEGSAEAPRTRLLWNRFALPAEPPQDGQQLIRDYSTRRAMAYVRAAPLPGLNWGIIYDADFRSHQTATSISATSLSIDGVTWYRKGSLSIPNYGLEARIDQRRGLGLRVQIYSYTRTDILFADSGDLSQPVWWLPFSSIPAYQPDAPVMVQVQVGYSIDSVDIAPNFVAGLASYSNTGPIAADERASESIVKLIANHSYAAYVKHGSGGFAPKSDLHVSDDYLVGPGSSLNFVSMGPNTYVTHAPWRGLFTVESVLGSLIPEAPSLRFFSGSRENPGFLFSFDVSWGFPSSRVLYIRAIRVLQPGLNA